MASSTPKGPFWDKFKYVFINREVINKDNGKHGVVLFRPVHQGTLDEPDGNTIFEVIWKENGQYDYVKAARMNWQQLQPQLQPRFVRTPCLAPMVEHIILPLQEANWHASDAEWKQLCAAAQAAAQALKAQTREEVKALEILTGERRAVEKAEAKQAAGAAAAKSKAAAAAKGNSKAGAAAAGPSSSNAAAAAAAAAAKPRRAGTAQPAGAAKKPAAATKKSAAAAPAAANKRMKVSASAAAAPAAKKAKKEAAVAAAANEDEEHETPSSSAGDANAAEDEEYDESEDQEDASESDSEEENDSDSDEDDDSDEESNSEETPELEDSDGGEGGSDDSGKPPSKRKQPTQQTPKQGVQKQQKKAAPASAGCRGRGASAAAEESEDETEEEEVEDNQQEQQRAASSKKGKQQPAAAAKQKTPKAAAGAKVYKGPTGRVYPTAVAFVKGDLRLGTKAYDAAADAEFNVECIVDEVSVTLPTKQGKRIMRKVLPKWEGYELDVNGWEDSTGLKHLDLYKDWTKSDKPDYYTAVTPAAAANAFTAWYNQQ